MGWGSGGEHSGFQDSCLSQKLVPSQKADAAQHSPVTEDEVKQRKLEAIPMYPVCKVSG